MPEYEDRRQTGEIASFVQATCDECNEGGGIFNLCWSGQREEAQQKLDDIDGKSSGHEIAYPGHQVKIVIQ